MSEVPELLVVCEKCGNQIGSVKQFTTYGLRYANLMSWWESVWTPRAVPSSYIELRDSHTPTMAFQRIQFAHENVEGCGADA